MINEITNITNSAGEAYTHQLSDKDDITTVNLNRCLRYIFDTYVDGYTEMSNQILNIKEEDVQHLLKFRIAPPTASLDADDNMNMGFGFDDPESSGYQVTDERGNFAAVEEDNDSGISYLEYVNYPSQIYRSIRSLGSTSAAKTLDVSYVDDVVSGGRYYDEPIGLRKASDTSKDTIFGVVGRLWNHSASLNEETLLANGTDQTISSGGWMPDSSDITPVSAYDAGIAKTDFAPTVAAMYANEFPYMLFSLLGNPDTTSETGTYTIPGYNSVEIGYTNVALNRDIGMTFGKITIMRGSSDYQELDVEIDLATSILEKRCPKKLLFAEFGNGFCSGVTAASYAVSANGNKPRVVNEIIAPTVLQTGDFSFILKDLTKTNVGENFYFNATTGFKKSDGAISNISVSNRSYEVYFMTMYQVNVWESGKTYSKYDTVWYTSKAYVSTVDNNTVSPSTENGSWSEIG